MIFAALLSRQRWQKAHIGGTPDGIPEIQYIGRHVPGPEAEDVLFSSHRCTGDV